MTAENYDTFFASQIFFKESLLLVDSTKWAEEYLCLAPAHWHLIFKKTVESANIIIIWLYS